MSVKIIGINHDMFISSAALIVDGKIECAIPEERLSREKMSRSFPHMAIDQCLKISGLKIEQIDYFANAYNPSVHFKKFNPIFSNNRRFRSDYFYSIPDNLINKFTGSGLDKDTTDFTYQEISYKGKKIKVYYITHHLCHAANSFFLSPFNSSAILTADGQGEDDTVNFLVGKKNKIEILKKQKIPHSLGSFYATFTEYLGYKPDSDEWKVMALGSYFNKKSSYFLDKISKMVQFYKDGNFELDQKYFKQYNYVIPNYYTKRFIEEIGPPRKKNENFSKRHYEIAYSMQKVFERIGFHMLNFLQKKTSLNNLVLSGGAFMNSVFNGKITKNTNFKKIWLGSCPDDSGLSIGAGLYLYNNILNKKKRYVMKHNYYGPDFNDAEILKVLKKFKLEIRKSKNVYKETANLISQKKIIGWFQGKMEFGQRALGHRSILADARYVESKNLLNAAVKYREAYRPFAPSILKEYSKNYFYLDSEIPFMEKVVLAKKKAFKDIPAVVHKDGSARVQTVCKIANPIFYKLINEYYKITRVPCIINTSFNVNGEPIVCTPEDAIKTFFSCGLDCLVIGNYILYK
jgi:carbamoyltransferase